ncbi:MAG TPA: glycyl-radical enzyme activating protein [Acidobacteriota bacterium]|nr:glycyl-radical enzyme activating protein [Acidobacteriota bacterium]
MESEKKTEEIPPLSAVITNIQVFSIHDGPGIRTVVFFKGCPLACRWCANPECLAGNPQMGFIENLCAGCGKCFDACPGDAIRRTDDGHRIDYGRCRSCGDCMARCLYGALTRYGDTMTLAQVWDAVRRDKIFYDESRGGVTVSGGEPLLRADFVRELFRLCRRERIDTCVETCGHVDPAALLEIIPVTDHFLFDLKHMNPETHRSYTGRSNEAILKNAEALIAHGADVVFRQPLIPGVNDTAENIEATARFLKTLGDKAARLEIMPFHGMGRSKYKALNMSYTMEELRAVDDEQAASVRNAYLHCGIDCSVSR